MKITNDMIDAAAEKLPATSGPKLGLANRREWAKEALGAAVAARVPWWRRWFRLASKNPTTGKGSSS